MPDTRPRRTAKVHSLPQPLRVHVLAARAKELRPERGLALISHAAPRVELVPDAIARGVGVLDDREGNHHQAGKLRLLSGRDRTSVSQAPTLVRSHFMHIKNNGDLPPSVNPLTQGFMVAA